MAAQQATAIENAAARPRNLRQKESDKKKPPGCSIRAAFLRLGGAGVY